MSHTLRSDGISATIKADGAELCSLKNRQGLELLWQAGPIWPRHAPILFPIVGRLKNDELRHHGKSLSDDAARLCAGPEVQLERAWVKILHLGSD